MISQDALGGPECLTPDVLIVGSGPIGAVFARKLIDSVKDIKVLMVDIGEQGSRLIGDHKKNNIATQRDINRFTSSIQGAWSPLSVAESTATLNLNPVSWPASNPQFVRNNQNPAQRFHDNLPAAVAVREVGGMGGYWTCCTPEQHPEIERPDIFSDEEWRMLYDDARSLFRTDDTLFDHSIRQDLIKKTLCRANPGRRFICMPLAGQRSAKNPEYVEWTATAQILGEAADPKYGGGKFELKTQHCCTSLRVDPTTGQVIEAKIKDLLTDEDVIVKAKKYVICAGAVLTAGILFASGIRPETGYPALGHYLTEQTVSLCQVVLKKALIESTWDDPRSEEHAQKFPHDPLRIPFNDPDPQITTPLSHEYPWHTQIHRDAFGYGAIPPEIDQRLVVDLRFFGYVKPVFENCVEFSSEVTDSYGMPQPTFHYRISEDDAERSHAMMKDMVNLASDLGGFLPGGEPRHITPGAALHICGTTRAGKEDDGHSVINRYSKVWRVDNLYVGGSGVIPTQNASNPTLTAACFAIIGAKKIAEELLESQSIHKLEKSRL
ncbi:pyranose 2-oxidase [Xylariaceae sp. FL0016]|nr:pyranose 2-oxidase [Xylariaceae sp. FL0016]